MKLIICVIVLAGLLGVGHPFGLLGALIGGVVGLFGMIFGVAMGLVGGIFGIVAGLFGALFGLGVAFLVLSFPVMVLGLAIYGVVKLASAH